MSASAVAREERGVCTHFLSDCRHTIALPWSPLHDAEQLLVNRHKRKDSGQRLLPSFGIRIGLPGACSAARRAPALLYFEHSRRMRLLRVLRGGNVPRVLP